MSPYSTSVRTSASVFDTMKSWWNQQPGPQSTPFLRAEWFQLWSNSFVPSQGRLEVVVIEDEGGDPVAALALFKAGMRRYSMSNSHSDVFDLVGSRSEEVLSSVRNWLARRPLTRFSRLDDESPLSASQQIAFMIDGRAMAPFVDLTDGVEGATSGLSKSHLSDIRRCERRLAETGEVVYLDNAEPVIPDALQRCIELEASGWKREAGTAIASRQDTLTFYRSLVELAKAEEWLRLSVLLVGEEIAAFQLNLDYAGRRFLLKIGYDEDLRSLSPGKVLQWKVLHAAAARGMQTHELGGEAESWKLDWTNNVRARVSALGFGTRGLARYVAIPLRQLARRRAA